MTANAAPFVPSLIEEDKPETTYTRTAAPNPYAEYMPTPENKALAFTVPAAEDSDDVRKQANLLRSAAKTANLTVRIKTSQGEGHTAKKPITKVSFWTQAR